MSNDFQYELPMETKMSLLREARPFSSRGDSLASRGDTPASVGGRMGKPNESRLGGPRPIQFEPAKTSTTIMDVGGVKARTPAEPELPRRATTTFDHPFKVVATTTEAGDPAVKVEPEGSSITDGINGTSLAITGLDTALEGSGLVVVKTLLNPDLTILSTSVSIVDAGDFAAVEIDVGTGEQVSAQRVLAKVTIADGAATIVQATFTALTLGYGFSNGMLVRVLTEGYSHPDSL